MIYLKTSNKISNVYSQLKDKVDINYQSNVVYKVPSLNCPAVYIGESKQYVCDRMYQHKNDVKNIEENDKKNSSGPTC